MFLNKSRFILFLLTLFSSCTIPVVLPFSTCDIGKQPVKIFSKQVPGFDLPRKIWCKLNRFRTSHGKCNKMLFRWNIRENPSCEFEAEKETIQHIVEECPLTKFQQDFFKLHLLIVRELMTNLGKVF
jgi:hypothetical protein